mmetsp:Transcript_32342/g.67546  ORF Transcript_32342/g.67546 Transcript_32342/m.67546 type:complete len:86 (+) Transcript_32342:114-371(+)
MALRTPVKPNLSKAQLSSALLLLGLLRQKDRMDVGQHAAGGDGDAAEQFVELLVVADGELNVTRNNTGLLVVARGVAGKLKNLGS